LGRKGGSEKRDGGKRAHGNFRGLVIMGGKAFHTCKDLKKEISSEMVGIPDRGEGYPRCKKEKKVKKEKENQGNLQRERLKDFTHLACP